MKSAKKLNLFNQKIKLEQFNDHIPLTNVQMKKKQRAQRQECFVLRVTA